MRAREAVSTAAVVGAGLMCFGDAFAAALAVALAEGRTLEEASGARVDDASQPA